MVGPPLPSKWTCYINSCVFGSEATSLMSVSAAHISLHIVSVSAAYISLLRRCASFPSSRSEAYISPLRGVSSLPGSVNSCCSLNPVMNARVTLLSTKARGHLSLRVLILETIGEMFSCPFDLKTAKTELLWKKFISKLDVVKIRTPPHPMESLTKKTPHRHFIDISHQNSSKSLR